ncbi:MAG: prepilin-type N-terminal cleavage/methylation domain-containing protein [Terriglobia bacterium]
MLRRLVKKEKGFTLVELMVVILIIAILVAIAIPVYNTARSSAKNKSCKGNLRTMDGAIQTYHSDTDTWPTALGDLDPDYVREVPDCPWETGATDCYALSGSGSTLSVTCTDASCPGDASGTGATNCLY